MRNKKFIRRQRLLQTLSLGAVCTVIAFTLGMRTAGEVHPFDTSEAATENTATTADVPRALQRGDVNGNGVLDAQDVIMILECAEGLDTPTSDDLRRLDVDGDYKCTVKDALRILHAISNR